MDVEVEGGGDGAVAKEGGDGLVVAAALDAASGETVLQERLLLDPGEDLQAVRLLCGGGKMNLEFRVRPGAGLLAVTQNHFQNRQ